MKKIFFLFLSVITSLTVDAQVIKIYENGILTDYYQEAPSSKYKIVFEEAPYAHLLTGKFTVNVSGKQVHFTKSNLYWDGSQFLFEANPTDYPSTWSTSHVGHFFWTNLTNYKAGTAAYMPYAEYVNFINLSTADHFWCCEDSKLSVEATNGFYVLSNDEWKYLFQGRTNASNLYKYNVTVGTSAGCLVIAPDDYDFNTTPLKESYTLDEVNSLGLVCLPIAYSRNSGEIQTEQKYGFYWTSTPDTSSSSSAYQIYFDESGITLDTTFDREYAVSVRLVKTVF